MRQTTEGDGVMTGEARVIAGELRDRGLLASFNSLLRKLRNDRSASILDVLIESHPEVDDGGASKGDLRGLPKAAAKIATHLGVAVDGGRVVSMGRVTFYGKGKGPECPVIGVLSMVSTLKSVMRKGFATKVMTSLMEIRPGIEMRLSVDRANAAAIQCYKRLGFVRNGPATPGLFHLAKKT